MIGNAKADPILINASSFLNSIIFHYIKQSVLNEELNNLADHGKQICLAGGANDIYNRCSTVRSLGEGICLAGGANDIYNRCSTVRSLGEGICLAGGANDIYNRCSTVRSLGEGICLAGGANDIYNRCSTVRSLGEGICLAGGANDIYNRCSTVRSLGEGIQLADNSGVDLKWAWDAFKDQNGYVAWVCRGTNTRRFAEQSQCGQSEKADRIWPGP
jgi:hypothetical protein